MDGAPPPGAPLAGSGETPGAEKTGAFFQKNPQKVVQEEKIQSGVAKTPALETPSGKTLPGNRTEEKKPRGGGQNHAHGKQGRTVRGEEFDGGENCGKDKKSEPRGGQSQADFSTRTVYS